MVSVIIRRMGTQDIGRRIGSDLVLEEAKERGAAIGGSRGSLIGHWHCIESRCR